MKELFEITGGLLLIALLVEAVFRMSNSFPGTVKNGFRWIYIIGCGALVVLFLWKGWNDIIAIRVTGEAGFLYGGILVLSLLFTVLLNRKKG